MKLLTCCMLTLIHWPTQEDLVVSMPMAFREKFGTKVAAIIDCFEIFIERPSNLYARAQTRSSYKHHNTQNIVFPSQRDEFVVQKSSIL